MSGVCAQLQSMFPVSVPKQYRHVKLVNAGHKHCLLLVYHYLARVHFKKLTSSSLYSSLTLATAG